MTMARAGQLRWRVWAMGVALAPVLWAGATRCAKAATLEEIAQSPRMMWNGVTVSTTGRIFAAFPSMEGTPTISVGEVLPGGEIRPFPGGAWNEQGNGNDAEHFIGVNSVVSDAADKLWVVDPAAGFGAKPEAGKAKLVRIDIATGAVERIYRFDSTVLPEGGFINDVRVGDGFAYLTDSGLGALIVLDLATGRARRALGADPRLKADPSLKLIVNGEPYLNARQQTPAMNVNPLELSTDGRYLYFQPNGGPRLYRLAVGKLRDFSIDDSALAAAVEDQGPTRFNAGMTMAPDGSIYFSDIEIGGITRRTPEGRFEMVAEDPARIAWPDASRLGPDGYLYFPASQVNRLPQNTPSGENRIERPFRMFRIKVMDR
ncbi:MAG: L-dopachrome tautomerase-related protein [Hyphomicrobium sp.]